ncbi:hypothetical protein NE237_008529 [Protea cynaroides]|uniref:Uncharacterized protein n=1 Tax=Protea cynaroides TaxID=273540 RepID=A0A9Q0KW72_9MAGN|nr:hypothetical protein NE237_008529 [Protea cynaroides]
MGGGQTVIVVGAGEGQLKKPQAFGRHSGVYMWLEEQEDFRICEDEIGNDRRRDQRTDLCIRTWKNRGVGSVVREERLLGRSCLNSHHRRHRFGSRDREIQLGFSTYEQQYNWLMVETDVL